MCTFNTLHSHAYCVPPLFVLLPLPSCLPHQSDPFVEIAKAQESGIYTVVYRSNPIYTTLNPKWVSTSHTKFSSRKVQGTALHSTKPHTWYLACSCLIYVNLTCDEIVSYSTWCNACIVTCCNSVLTIADGQDLSCPFRNCVVETGTGTWRYRYGTGTGEYGLLCVGRIRER